ncbi:hypothetical protein GIB67_035199 [Kingdonia uniflora]|uniref:Uncharacterized protein n=1 Tax=Kingdonia uniflora TaxID=39325 RepID=A0A7J7LE03_9MAGN|nr:hypothetical protein GIB67_035199 [Kingdonia uniflora]
MRDTTLRMPQSKRGMVLGIGMPFSMPNAPHMLPTLKQNQICPSQATTVVGRAIRPHMVTHLPQNSSTLQQIGRVPTSAITTSNNNLFDHPYTLQLFDAKSISILETVATVRSFDVILERFQHLLTMREDHKSIGFSSREMIMTMVLEGSEDISPEKDEREEKGNALVEQGTLSGVAPGDVLVSTLHLQLVSPHVLVPIKVIGYGKYCGRIWTRILGAIPSEFKILGIRSLCVNPRSYMVFAGSTAGYSHCWDLRTMKPLWEKRVSPNVIYSVQHLGNDTSSLVVGGIDGILRILNQHTGEVISSYVMDEDATGRVPLFGTRSNVVQKKKVRRLSEDAHIDLIPKNRRPPITCLAVGMKKVVTTHNNKFIRIWKFNV